MDILKQINEGIKAHRACAKFKEGDIASLVEQLFTPQGVEFVLNTSYPNLYTFRDLQEQVDLKPYGIFVDAGNITLKEQRRAFIIGETTANLEYSDLASNTVCAMYGAKVNISASGYAVVRIEHDELSEIYTNAIDNAVILW